MRFSFNGRAARGIVFALTAALALPVDALACTQIYAGRNLTTTGDTLVGRSEDYASRHAKAFGVQAPMTNPTYTSQEATAFSYTYTGTTLRYTYVRDTAAEWDGDPMAYAEAGVNEKGVSVSATLTTGYNDKIAAVDPCGSDAQPDNPWGLGEYNIAEIVLGQATSARDGVVLLGKICDEHGNYDLNQILISDNTETWIFMQLSGHQWCAVKAPDDQVSVNPNMGRLKFAVDLSDPDVCLHSADMIDVAKKAGTWDDAAQDVATAYGETESGAGQNTRYAQGHAYFGDVLEPGSDYNTNDAGQVATIADPQLFFTPATERIDTYTMLRSFAARGEQVDALNANLNKSLYAIGNNRTVETHLFQIDHSLPAELATVQWEALSRSEFSVAIPVYSALLTTVDKNYYPEPADFDVTHQGASQREDSQAEAMKRDEGTVLDYVFMDLNTLAYNNRESVAPGVAAYLKALQQELIAQQVTVEKDMVAASADKRSELANEYFERATKSVYTKADALLNEVRDYLEAGNTSEPFAASDLYADGTLKTPVEYAKPKDTDQPATTDPAGEDNGNSETPATEATELTITAQPQSVTALQGEAVTLKVEATAGDAPLSYQWFKKDALAASGSFAKARRLPTDVPSGFLPIAGATSATLDVDTAQPGKTDYVVAVSTEDGQRVLSQVARVTVNKNLAAQGAQQGAQHASAHSTPKTGDYFNVLVPIACAVGAAVIIAASVIMRRKK